MNTLRLVLFSIGAAGALLFGVSFTTSILNPGYVEEIAKDVIKIQVEKKTHEKIDAMDAKFLAGKAGTFMKAHVEEIERVKGQLKANLPERVAAIVAEMRNLDCECRKKIAKNYREVLELQLLVATAAQERLTTLLRTKYMETAEKLTREFRIFTATNALVFALLAFAAYYKRAAAVHLLLPAVVLVIAASVTGYLYLFSQNWLHTIVFSDYVGLAYIGYMAFVFAFLCDALFNRARITVRLLNFALNALGSVASLSPC